MGMVTIDILLLLALLRHLVFRIPVKVFKIYSIVTLYYYFMNSFSIVLSICHKQSKNRTGWLMTTIAEEVGRAKFSLAMSIYATVAYSIHYRITFKHNLFKIILRGVQGCIPTMFWLK